ncbi:MAG TPA: YihY/virulence factor BrkB family protein [Bacteroidales bacterium]|nr:YihY/virulence factor BrkB family protein [Bacteroidales bacterium]
MAKSIPWLLQKVKSLNDTIWHTPLADISKSKLFLIKQLRIAILAARGFTNDKVQLRASSLTLYTLISIIPVIAIAFAIAKGFGLDQNLEQLIIKEMQTHPEFFSWLLEKAQTAISQTRGGYLAGIGAIVLLWAVMSLLDQIESSFNQIWQIRSSRPWYRKFTDYLALMLIAPVFLIAASSVTVFIGTELSDFMNRVAILDFFKPIVSFFVKVIPYFIFWIVLTIVYMTLPNTKVKFLPALVSGIISGTILQLLQWIYIDLQFGISRLSAIYGSFAAIPLFIVFLQSSWLIVLLGAEVSFANQNLSRYEYESEALNVSHYQKRALVIMIMNMITRNFSDGSKPLSAENIASNLKIPVRLVRDILQDLSNAELVSVIHDEDHTERLYQPAMDINKMTISWILNKLEKKGTEHQIFVKGKEYHRVVEMLDKFDDLINRSEANILIKDL